MSEWSKDMVRLCLQKELELPGKELLEFEDFDGSWFALCINDAEDPLKSMKLEKIQKKAIATMIKELMNPIAEVEHSQSIPFINFETLQVEDTPLASGSFKSVYKAVWAPAGSNEVLRKVAVLVLRQGGSATLEIKIFECLGLHQNLVKLLAVTRMPPAGYHCMVQELAERGSLDCVLQELAQGQEAEQASNAVLLTAACQVTRPLPTLLICLNVKP